MELKEHGADLEAAGREARPGEERRCQGAPWPCEKQQRSTSGEGICGEICKGRELGERAGKGKWQGKEGA